MDVILFNSLALSLSPPNGLDVEVQVELDSEMTVAKLGPLDQQGTDESYLCDDESPADCSVESKEKNED